MNQSQWKHTKVHKQSFKKMIQSLKQEQWVQHAVNAKLVFRTKNISLKLIWLCVVCDTRQRHQVDFSAMEKFLIESIAIKEVICDKRCDFGL